MTAIDATAFDHLDLDDEARDLIRKAVGVSPRVFLAPLDKGLSGASVWRARWELRESGELSALHVFKIGDRFKLGREVEAIGSIAAAIDPDTRFVTLVEGATGQLCLLRQSFAGEDPAAVVSLRDYLRNCDHISAVQAIDDLYTVRMSRWHVTAHGRQVNQKFADALDWWISRADLVATAELLNREALEGSLRSRYGMSIDDLVGYIDDLKSRIDSFVVGPVHGDLHAQNVLVDQDLRMHLIDFGWCAQRWRAVDFLMLECSIRYVVTPRFARLGDLMKLQEVIDKSENYDDELVWAASSMYGPRLASLGAAILKVRELAVALGACRDLEQYRRGLILMTAGLTSMPYRINHPFMFHSMAAMAGRATA
jgi:hypothetical protein